MRTRLPIAVAVVGLLLAPAGALASHGGKAKSESHVRGDPQARRHALGGETLTFQLTTATKVETHDNGTIADGDRGEISIKGPAGLDAAALQKLVPRRVEDEARDEDDNDGDDHGGDGDHGGHGQD
jgi:hypothetical protein